uniref:Uncharacterized protein n=1 Tax=Ditylenchus dipsaci TaxID=166011 RepID=A0A915DJF5_9BILA
MTSIFQASVPQEFDDSVRSLKVIISKQFFYLTFAHSQKNHFVGHPYATLLAETSVCLCYFGEKRRRSSYAVIMIAPFCLFKSGWRGYARNTHRSAGVYEAEVRVGEGQKIVAANPQSDKRKQKASEIEQIYERQFNLCKSELAAMTKVYRHHTTASTIMSWFSTQHAKFARSEIEKARAADDPLYEYSACTKLWTFQLRHRRKL